MGAAYTSVVGEEEVLYEIKKSKFYASLLPARDWVEAKAKLDDVKRRYPDATHHCYAFRGSPEGNESRLGDDGEPSGTAAAPIWNVITKRELFGVIAIVTRYFGGIKLGANGLVGAYGAAAAMAADAAHTVEIKPTVLCSLTLPYGALAVYEAKKENLGIQTEDIEYRNDVKLTVAVSEEKWEAFRQTAMGITLGVPPIIIEYTTRAFEPVRR